MVVKSQFIFGDFEGLYLMISTGNSAPGRAGTRQKAEGFRVRNNDHTVAAFR